MVDGLHGNGGLPDTAGKRAEHGQTVGRVSVWTPKSWCGSGTASEPRGLSGGHFKRIKQWSILSQAFQNIWNVRLAMILRNVKLRTCQVLSSCLCNPYINRKLVCINFQFDVVCHNTHTSTFGRHYCLYISWHFNSYYYVALHFESARLIQM